MLLYSVDDGRCGRDCGRLLHEPPVLAVVWQLYDAEESKAVCRFIVSVGAPLSAGREAVRRDYLGPLLRHVSAPLLAGDMPGTRKVRRRRLSRDDLMETLPDLELHDKDKLKLFGVPRREG